MKILISIVGTTGIGKTRLAIDLAKYLSTQILSCDSRQFFREMKIGTAAPTKEELAEVPHHFIGNLSVTEYYSIGQFEKDALQKLDEIFQYNDVAILVGGSMMYEKAVTEGLHDLPEANEENQQKLQKIWKEQGLEVLRQQLKTVDPEYYQTVDRENPRRILRALDVIWQTNKKYSAIIAAPKSQRKFSIVRIGIEAPREMIYDRINRRVTQMMATGLEAEAQKLLPFRDLVPLQTVGYSELFHYFDGLWDLEFAVSEIQKNSRRFAKRQLTWYRKEDNIHWVNYVCAFEESLSLLKSLNIQP